MTTVVSTAVGLVLTALSQSPAVCPVIGRTRLRPLGKGDAQAVIVRPLAALPLMEAGTMLGTGLVALWEVRMQIEMYARAEPDESPDEAVDALLQAVYTRLGADPTLGGQGLVQPAELRYEYAAESENTVCAQLAVAVRLDSSTPTQLTT